MLLTATNDPCAPRAALTAAASRWVADMTGPNSWSGRSVRVSTWDRVASSVCPLNTGRMSRKATTSGSSSTMFAGVSPAMMAQKRHFIRPTLDPRTEWRRASADVPCRYAERPDGPARLPSTPDRRRRGRSPPSDAGAVAGTAYDRRRLNRPVPTQPGQDAGRVRLPAHRTTGGRLTGRVGRHPWCTWLHSGGLRFPRPVGGVRRRRRRDLRTVDPGHRLPAGGGGQAEAAVPLGQRRRTGAHHGAAPSDVLRRGDAAVAAAHDGHPGRPDRGRALSGVPARPGRERRPRAPDRTREG